MKTKILVIEDDNSISELICMNLEAAGYEAFPILDGLEAERFLKALNGNDISLALVDVMLPGKDGFALMEDLQRVSIPVIYLTAKGDVLSKVQGLKSGAEDYIVKPFSGGEVMARVRAVLRRLERAPQDRLETLSYDNLSVCLESGFVSVGGTQVILTKKELEILWLLLENKERIFSRDNLLNSIWGYDYYGDNRTVDSHIKRLRAKLDAVPHPEWQIKTIWGMGYKFEGKPNEV